MKEALRLYCLEDDKGLIKPFIDSLNKAGYKTTLNDEFDPTSLVILLLSKNLTPIKAFAEFPWLKQQYEHSSIPNLRIMPLYIYDGSKEDLETSFEEKAGENYEEIFSGEFKPFGFDLSSENPLQEWERVLEEYM